MGDLTILFLTNERLPQKWQEYHRAALDIAAQGLPILTIGRTNGDLIQDHEPSKANIFWQMLRGAKHATTEYIGIAEDDTLYPPGHFDTFRADYAFNQHRWSLYTWNQVYHLKNYLRTNATFIGRRTMVIDALEERFARYPMGTEMPYWMGGEIGVAEKHLNLTPRKAQDYKSELPVVQLDHDFFTVYDTSKETVERRHRKRLGTIKAYDIPYWHGADELLTRFI